MPLFPHQTAVATSTAGTSTPTSVTASTGSVSLLAANTLRKGATITNASTATLYVEFGATASATAYTVQMGAGDYYEVPANYTGAISGIWSAVNGSALVRELT